jgi:hypothetical protein
MVCLWSRQFPVVPLAQERRQEAHWWLARQLAVDCRGLHGKRHALILKCRKAYHVPCTDRLLHSDHSLGYLQCH